MYYIITNQFHNKDILIHIPTMIRIRIFSNFCDSKTCKVVYERLCESTKLDFYGEDKQVYITDDDNYTHVIIMNTAMPVLNIPKQNVLGLAFEPFEFLNISREFIEYSKKYIGKYFIGDKRNLPDPFVEHFGYMWYSNPLRDIVNKSKIMSIIVSEKMFAPGHKYRHELVTRIIKDELPIDIYGRGCKFYKSKFIKGEFISDEPYEDYMYSICIENYRENHYLSEKIMSPILFNCMPVYLGCIKINEYFDDVLILSGDVDRDIQMLHTILENPTLYHKKMYNDKNINTVNLLKNINCIFN